MLNVWPAKPDHINGSERIANVAELSGTPKICAGLRKQFLPYFTDGVLIGNCFPGFAYLTTFDVGGAAIEGGVWGAVATGVLSRNFFSGMS